MTVVVAILFAWQEQINQPEVEERGRNSQAQTDEDRKHGDCGIAIHAEPFSTGPERPCDKRKQDDGDKGNFSLHGPIIATTSAFLWRIVAGAWAIWLRLAFA
ncbi:MAG TPA: hypothetical protein VFI31_17120 [Pirellulales bacterium]|nr:hypothetical protein [Pirellulales bacterium]